MEDERAAQIDPSTLVHGLVPDQIPAELDVTPHKHDLRRCYSC